MKYFAFIACLGLLGAAAYHFAADRTPHAPKYYAVEPETAVRPERFEQLKYHAVDVRMPASEH